MMFQSWGGVLETSFQSLWTGVLLFIPNLVVALVILGLGWAIAALVGHAITKFLDTVRLDEALKKTGFESVVKRAGLELRASNFVGWLFKAAIIIIFLIAAFDVLGLVQVTQFLSQVVLGYLPQLVVAVLILLVGVVIGDALEKVVVASSRTAGITSSGMLGKVAKWAVWIFAILVALSQMGIAGAFIQTLFTGFVVAVSLALGLSFGLGGQEAAADAIKKVREEIKERR
jgi:small-conductance mechanosensitive channel